MVGLAGEQNKVDLGQLINNLVTTGQVTGKVWIDKNTKDMLKAVLTVPGPSAGAGAGKSGTVTITETNIDTPVTVSAP